MITAAVFCNGPEFCRLKTPFKEKKKKIKIKQWDRLYIRLLALFFGTLNHVITKKQRTHRGYVVCYVAHKALPPVEAARPLSLGLP